MKIRLDRRLKTGSWIGCLMESLSLSKSGLVRRSGGDIGESSAEEWNGFPIFGGEVECGIGRHVPEWDCKFYLAIAEI
jgi:hypothetical protein